MRRATTWIALTLAVGCAATDNGSSEPFVVTATYPHDPEAYTQGLVWADGVLFESTGRYGHSELRRVDLSTGRVLARRSLGTDRFGEGLALHGERLFQLTWESGVVYVYTAETLAPIDSFTYSGEGWGLASDGTSLFLSDGSDSIRVISPETFRAERVVRVRYRGEPLRRLNELEFVGGVLLANVYETNYVARIDPITGEVREVMDFGALYPNRAPYAEVMNGIAIAPESGQLLLTGKRWPIMFQVQLPPSTVP
jgi:glutamine cyclotransferase